LVKVGKLNKEIFLRVKVTLSLYKCGIMSKVKIVLANGSLTAYPMGGGHWAVFLQYILGLKALGHDVIYLEVFRSTGDKLLDKSHVDSFFNRMEQFGLKENCILLLFQKDVKILTLEAAQEYGKSKNELKDIAQSADLLWNFCAALNQPLLSLFRRRVFIDLDPGHLQVSALDVDMGLDDHHVFLTVGRKINDPDCEVPRLGKKWHAFSPFIYLPLWKQEPNPGFQASFSSITQWTWAELWYKDQVLSISKRDSYLRYIELPKLAMRPFELAVNIHPDDKTGDRELLQDYGWKLVDPHRVANSPESYREYIALSRAEIVCPKPIFTELKTGWLSDRSACYLASGRPVLTEDTGFSDYLPTGEGLLVFRDINEALAGIAEIDSNYEHHMRSARRFAEEFLNSQQCLEQMINFCG
jgi:hypothetical protein